LVDKGESLESAAMRELEEETGYKAEGVIEISHLMVCDPGTFLPAPNPFVALQNYLTTIPNIGMSSANMKLVVLKVPVPDAPSSPKQKLEAGEHIIRRVVELAKLKEELDGTLSISRSIYYNVWSEFD
jgi:ADP-ribose pyrophosphatase